jgi:chaperonin GroEL
MADFMQEQPNQNKTSNTKLVNNSKFTFKHNALSEKDTKIIIKDTLKFIADIIASSIGPYGSNTIVQDTEMQHYTTKDGFNILSRLAILDAPQRALLDMIRRISKNLVKEVGDGSSSCIVVASKLYTNLLYAKKKLDIPDPILMKHLMTIKRVISSALKENRRKINSLDELRAIANIASNNNGPLADFITEIFNDGKGGINESIVFHIDLAPNEEQSYEKSSGFEHKRGIMDMTFLRENKNLQASLKEPVVFMTNGVLDRSDLNTIIAIIERFITGPSQNKEISRPVIFLAKAFDPFVMDLFRANKQKFMSAFPVYPIDIATGTQKTLDIFNDLATFLGATPLDKISKTVVDFDLDTCFGTCREVHISDKRTKFIEGSINTTAALEIVTQLKSELATLEQIESKFDTSEQETELKRRIASLSESMVKVFVGGYTEMEKKANLYLVEDAMLACQSALESGYTVGCNLSIPLLISEVSAELQEKYAVAEEDVEPVKMLLKALGKSFLYAYWKILLNYYGYERKDKINEIITTSMQSKSVYNLISQSFEPMKETLVINPVKTEIEILNATFSIIGLLVNSNQFLALSLN